MTATPATNAEVIAVFPNKVRVLVEDIAAFTENKPIKVGSYLRRL